MIVDEKTALLRSDPHSKKVPVSISKKRITGLALVFILLFLSLISYFTNIDDNTLGDVLSLSQRKPPKRNLIFFVTDGMGPASLSLARSFRQYTEGLPEDDVLTLDKHLIGTSRTRSSNSLVTDSAAGATAFSCALKTYNNAVGVNRYGQPCGTILEGAKLNGYMTGLVVTTRITDATPGAFSAHADYRFQEDLIALHQLGEYPLGRMVDLILGGGRTHFYSGGNGSRKDGRNLLQEAVKDGWQVVQNRKEFDMLQYGENVSLPLLGLMSDYDIPYDVDRVAEEHPSLEEMTITALNALKKATENSDKGFFIMIEGSRIDHAGHQNDPAAQVREVLAFDKAFKYALEFAEQSDVETIVLSTSDHETGGLVAARQVTETYPEYLWYPDILANAKHSGSYLKDKILNFNGTEKEKHAFVENEIIKGELNFTDYSSNDVIDLAMLTNGEEIQERINKMVSYRAQVGWTTHGHSAVDVNIYGYANRKSTWKHVLEHLQGNHENTEIGAFMANYLNVDLRKVTDLVNGTQHSPEEVFAFSAEEEPLQDEYHHLLKGKGMLNKF